MAVPKRKLSHSRVRRRRAMWRAEISVPSFTICSHCGKKIPLHTVCPYCGVYRNIQILKIPSKEEKKKS
ncbi:MAG: 50S ribosomal protein L32 [bacterium JZ-2024 1]